MANAHRELRPVTPSGHERVTYCRMACAADDFPPVQRIVSGAIWVCRRHTSLHHLYTVTHCTDVTSPTDRPACPVLSLHGVATVASCLSTASIPTERTNVAGWSQLFNSFLVLMVPRLNCYQPPSYLHLLSTSQLCFDKTIL